MNSNDKANTPFVRRFLIASRYRVARHLLLLSIITIISLNQSVMTFLDGMDVIGNGIYLQATLILVSYLLTGYFNFLYLLPRYLLKKKYAQYILLLMASVLLMVVLQTVEEYCVLKHFNIPNASYDFPNVYINTFSSFAIILPSLSGPAVVILLRYWLAESERIGEVEKWHIQSEVEQLKEQVSPHLLFSSLNRAGVLAKHQPADASEMLIRLSQLLRYQLYDCNREQVLLSSEIKFLNNYMALEQAHAQTIGFTMREDKGASYILVAPLLFISFVQAAVIEIHKLNTPTALEVEFLTTQSGVTFGCRSLPAALFTSIDYSRISQRLNHLYPNRHILNISATHITLKLEL